MNTGYCTSQVSRPRYPTVAGREGQQRHRVEHRLAHLLKERVGDRSEILRAITETVAGRSVVDPVVVEALVRRRLQDSDGGPSALAGLTEREPVLEEMAAGRSNTAIGERLHLSRSAIEKHVNAIFTKLGLVEEPSTHRRVAAVVAYLSDSPGPSAG